MATLRITQTRSAAGRIEKQKRTLAALGLRKIGDRVEKPDRSEIRGMIERIRHLVNVETVEDEASAAGAPRAEDRAAPAGPAVDENEGPAVDENEGEPAGARRAPRLEDTP